jgi:hypothetical protein
MANTKLSDNKSLGWIIILLLALIGFTIHIISKGFYELHRDELLYAALGHHLSWGYVTVPPSIAFFAAVSCKIFGFTTFAIGLFPALLGSFTLILTCLIAKELGGRNWAIFITGLSVLVSTSFLRVFSLFQPVCFDFFYWVLSCYLILRLVNTRDPRIWMSLFVVWGLAFLNKYMIIFLVAGFFIVFLLSSYKKLMRSWYFLIGMVIGFFIILPNAIWQITHRFPVLNHMTELRESQLVNVSPGSFLLMQILMNFPILIVWVFGLIYLLFFKTAKPYRFIGYLFIFILTTFLLLKGKAYYTLGIYPVMIAAGGYAIEKYFTGRIRFLKWVVVLVIIIAAVPVMPYGLPILPPDTMVKYGRNLSKFFPPEPVKWEDGGIHSLPQDYADMLGWEELVKIIADKYNSLSYMEKESCVIFAENYGEAGALYFYGKKYNLPEPLSFHESFIFWTPYQLKAESFIKVGKTDDMNELTNNYELIGKITNPYAREYGLPVYYCWNLKPGLFQIYSEKVKRQKDKYK